MFSSNQPGRLHALLTLLNPTRSPAVPSAVRPGTWADWLSQNRLRIGVTVLALSGLGLLAFGFFSKEPQTKLFYRAAPAGCCPDEVEAMLASNPSLADLAPLEATYAFHSFVEAIPDRIMDEPTGGARRPDETRRIYEELSQITPPESSHGYLLYRASNEILFLRGEVPDESARERIVHTLKKAYPQWQVDDRLRVDKRLSWPEHGSLLTLSSIPSAKVAADDSFLAYADFGEPWLHCRVPHNAPQTREKRVQMLGLSQNQRAQLDLSLLVAPVTVAR